MAQTGVIIQRRAGLTIPEQYTTLALKENPTAWGVAIPTPAGLQINSGDGMDLELFNNSLKEFNDRDIYFYLCNVESAVNIEDDVPPFNIIENSQELPELILFLDGEFPGFKKPDSSHPSMYHFVQDFVIPEMQAMYELADQDTAKVLGQLDKPVFRKKMLAHASGNCAMTFVTANGKACTLVQGDGHSEYKWGWVSKNYGYAVAEADPPKEGEKAKKSLFPSRSTVREKAPTAGSDVPPSGTSTTPPVSAGATVVGNGTIGVRKVKPKPGLSRAERKTFYKRFIGYFPEGGDKEVEVEVYYDKETNQLMTIGEVRKLGMDAVSVPILQNPPRMGGSKDTEPDHIGGGEKPTGPAVTTEVLPIIPPKSREYAKDILRREDVKKLIAENGDVVSDPSRIQEEEKKIAGFGEQLGVKTGLKDFASLSFLSFEEQQKWGAEDPKSYNVFVRSLICYYLSVEAGKKNKLTAEETHTVAQEELRPPKKSLFPKRAVA